MRPLGKPPNERGNWDRLNEGQRRYAWEQYRLAQVRRGITFDHPVAEGRGNPDHGGDDLDQLLDRPAEGEQDLARELGQELEGQEDAERQAIEDFDESYFESNHQGNSRQPTSSNDHGMASTSGMNTTGNKRAGDATHNGPRKRGPVNSNAVSSSGRTTGLPGTGKGQGEGSPETEGGPRPGPIVRPSTSIHSYIRYYRKVHRIYTYGISYQVLPEGSSNKFVITTPLCNIPWDMLYMYVNPSEQALLPNGSSVVSCRTKVSQRNVRVAFETLSSTTSLATLNQNKNIIYAVGLNKKCDGRNFRLTIGSPAGKKNVPTAVTATTSAFDLFASDEMYGNAENVDSAMPRHQFGQPMVWNNYYGVVYHRGSDNDQQDGWPCFQQFISECDADASTGSEIVSVEYHPKVGLCKNPPKKIWRKYYSNILALPYNITINRSGHSLVPHTQTINIGGSHQNDTSGPQGTTESESTCNQTWANMFATNVQRIEKCQQLHQGLFEHEDVMAQPSLHVGVQPQYAIAMNVLNTEENDLVTNNNFTDCQALFEIVSECEINTNYSTFRPLTLEKNVLEGDMWERNTVVPDYYSPMIDGLYVNPTNG